MPTASTGDASNVVEFVHNVGVEIADVIQMVTSNDIGAFLIGLYVLATVFHLVWGKVRHG
jgi:hypothetical protein